MITYKIKIGKGMLEFQANDMKTIHKWSDVWGALPSKCSCGSDDIHLSFTKTQEGFEYCKLKCKHCGATYTIKQSKAGEYFIDPKEKFEVYKKPQHNQASNLSNPQYQQQGKKFLDKHKEDQEPNFNDEHMQDSDIPF